MARNVFLAAALVFLASACEPTVVKRGPYSPPPGEAQLSPHDRDVQYPNYDRDKER